MEWERKQPPGQRQGVSGSNPASTAHQLGDWQKRTSFCLSLFPHLSTGANTTHTVAYKKWSKRWPGRLGNIRCRTHRCGEDGLFELSPEQADARCHHLSRGLGTKGHRGSCILAVPGELSAAGKAPHLVKVALLEASLQATGEVGSGRARIEVGEGSPAAPATPFSETTGWRGHLQRGGGPSETDY